MLAVLLVLPNFLAVNISKVWLQFPGMDKPTHFVAFMAVFLIVYAVLQGCAWPRGERERLGMAVGISLGFSLADEVQQAVLGLGRTAEYGDLVADAAGIFVGLAGVTARRFGVKRAVSIIVLLLMPVAGVTVKTYHDLNHYYRGMGYEREHDYDRARAEYMLALSSGFRSAALYNTIAWLDIEFLGANPVQAEYFAAKALELDNDNPDILDTYGWVLVRQGRPRDGLAFLEKAKTLNPNIYCINLHLGLAYRDLGEWAHAVEHLKQQIALSPEDRFGQAASKSLREIEGLAE